MGQVITELTPEQEALFPLFLEEWMGVNTDTEPADRPRAEAAITALYREAGFAPPRFVWSDSPLGAHEAMNERLPGGEAGNTLQHELREYTKSRIFKSLDPSGSQKPAKWFLEDLQNRAETPMYDQMGRAFPWEIENLLCGELRGKYWRPFFYHPWGQQEASWIAVYRFFLTLGIVYEGKGLQLLHLWEEVVRSCFWWWPFQETCFVSDRPRRMKLDPTFRFHCPDDSVMAFRDGWEIHAWRGMVVPREIVMEPVTLKTIGASTNIEHQRVMIERYGLERFIEDHGAREVARDDQGVLLEFKMAGGARQHVVKVLNPTPGPDGWRRSYLLPLRGLFNSPTDAIGSTFGLPPGAYKPTAQA